MRKHALLSPSSAHRWLKCTPSARLATKYPNKSSEYADEGTHAHSLCELLLQQSLGLITREKYKYDFAEIKKSKYYDKSMLSYCQDFRDYVLEVVSRFKAMNAGGVKIDLEVNTNLAEYIPYSFGAIDVRIHNDIRCAIIDFKYGKGVKVDAEGNEQFSLYALGTHGELHKKGYKLETFELHVYQPRINNIGMWELSRAELIEWYSTDVLVQANAAYYGKGEYKAGPHCQFCPAKANCKTFAAFNMGNIDEAFNLPNSLDMDFITRVVLNARLFESWIKSVKDFALERAQKGVKFPGMKLVEGRSNRYINDEKLAALELSLAGVDDDIIYKPQSLNTIGELEKQLGKKTVADLLDGYIEKPEGAPTFAPDDDARKEIGHAHALDVFKDLLK